MNEKLTTEWWRWEMYRLMADFINRPSDVNEARIKALMGEYRNFHDKHLITDELRPAVGE